MARGNASYVLSDYWKVGVTARRFWGPERPCSARIQNQ
jgi:hypothetical protein